MRMQSSILAILMLFGLASCGGSAGPNSEVSSVRTDKSVLRVGQRTGVEVEFSVSVTQEADTNILDDEEPGYFSDPSELAINIPVGLRFVENSSSLNDNFFGDNIFGDEDPRGPNRFVACPDGSTTLLYLFSTDELDADNPLAKRIRFEADASSAEGIVEITATAARTVSGLCPLRGERSTTIELVP